MQRRMRQAGLSLISLCIGLVLTLSGLELLVRFLPVNEGARPQPVDQDHPVRYLEPQRTFVWSSGWNFPLINHVRTNNYGFVNDQAYEPASTSPLLALIGDSYVEALMIPFTESVAGRLAKTVAPTERVYSFGTSSSALSSYLAYARYASQVFHPQAMAFMIIGNDFDESLLKYKNEPGHHYFAEDAMGNLELIRLDYRPSLWRTIARTSALVRYLTLNTDLLNFVLKWQHLPFGRPSHDAGFVGNTSASVSPLRMMDSQRAVDAFLASVSEMSGLQPDRMLFVVDGMRPQLYEPSTLPLATGSYFGQMRRYFMEQAREKGFEVIDLQTHFSEHYQQHRQRVDFSTDSHWNSLGHEICSEAIIHSAWYATFRALADSEPSTSTPAPVAVHPF